MAVDGSPELARLERLGWTTARFTTDAGVFVARADTAVDYPTEGLAALGLHGGSGYWFDHRARAVLDALRATTDARSIWDVGAGTGAMTVRLARGGFDVVAVEPLPEGAAAIARLDAGAVFCAALGDLDLPDRALRAVGLFDVIEHLADPSGLLREVRRVLAPGGVVAVTVPAFSSLWSTEDEVAGHHRRYTRAGLIAAMNACGFEAARTEYLFGALLLPALLLRALPYRLGRRRSAAHVHAATTKQLAPRASVDTAARTVMRAERALSRVVPLPAGLSVLGIFRVPEGGGIRPVPAGS